MKTHVTSEPNMLIKQPQLTISDLSQSNKNYSTTLWSLNFQKCQAISYGEDSHPNKPICSMYGICSLHLGKYSIPCIPHLGKILGKTLDEVVTFSKNCVSFQAREKMSRYFINPWPKDPCQLSERTRFNVSPTSLKLDHFSR